MESVVVKSKLDVISYFIGHTFMYINIYNLKYNLGIICECYISVKS